MPYLESLIREVQEMWVLVLSQHQKSLIALTSFDKDLAREIVLLEERVNSCEQFIESDCEHYFTLGNLQAENIAGAMLVLKITRRLEIIGDLAKKIATDILQSEVAYPEDLIEKLSISDLFKASNTILELGLDAFANRDESLAQRMFRRAEISYGIITETHNSLIHCLSQSPESLNQALSLFSILEINKNVIEFACSLAQEVLSYTERHQHVQ